MSRPLTRHRVPIIETRRLDNVPAAISNRAFCDRGPFFHGQLGRQRFTNQLSFGLCRLCNSFWAAGSGYKPSFFGYQIRDQPGARTA
jgi:hypothetical protein